MMTSQEMNEFLQSIGGLINGYSRDQEPITDCSYFSVGKGWYPLIKELIEDLIQLGWDRQVVQVKEKFGGLRFYINSASDEVHDRISTAERDSLSICEITGTPGELRGDIGWWVTLCDEEYEKRKVKQNG